MPRDQRCFHGLTPAGFKGPELVVSPTNGVSFRITWGMGTAMLSLRCLRLIAAAMFWSLPALAQPAAVMDDNGGLHIAHWNAEAGAFEEVSKGRRPAAWTLQGLWTDLPLFAHLEPTEPTPPLPALDAVDRLRSDYRTVGLSVDLHPIELIRSALEQLGCLRVGDLLRRRPGDRVRVAGLVSSRQRPGTASGVVFMTFEDETGMVNLVVWPKIWARFQKMARSRSLLGCDGRLQRQDDAISVLVERLWEVPEPPRPSSDEGGEAAPSIGSLPVRSHDFH